MEKDTTYNGDLDYTTEDAIFYCYSSDNSNLTISASYIDHKGISSSFAGKISQGWSEIDGERKLILD